MKIKLSNSDPVETTEDNNEAIKEVEIQEPKDFELKSIYWNDPLFVGENDNNITVANKGGKGIALVSLMHLKTYFIKKASN